MSDVCGAIEVSGCQADAWCLDHVLIDWLTIRQPNDGRYRSLNDGHVIRIDRCGEVVFESAVSIEVPGSFDTSARLRSTPDFVELVINPSRFDRGDNLFGVRFEDAVVACNDVLAQLGLAPLVAHGEQVLERNVWSYDDLRFSDIVKPLGFVVNRVDVTVNVETGSSGCLAAYLRFLGRQVLPRRKTRRYDGTVIFGQRSSSVSVYDKAREMRAHGVDGIRAKVADWCEQVGLARVELRLNRDCLKRKNLRLGGDLDHQQFVDVLREELSCMPKDCNEADLDMLTDRQLGVLLMWQRGFDLRARLSQSAFYRHKKIIKSKTGFDIAGEAPLRLEPKAVEFTTKAAVPPDWYVMPDGRKFSEHKKDSG